MKKVICAYCGKFLYSESENMKKLIIVDNMGKLRKFNKAMELTFCSMDCLTNYNKYGKKEK